MLDGKRRVRVRVPQEADGNGNGHVHGRGDSGDEESVAFSGLHWVAAGLFAAAGLEAALAGARYTREAGPLRWAPLVTAPAAGLAHAVRALRPGPANRMAVQLLDGVALGIGVAAAATTAARAARRDDIGGWRGRRWGRRLSDRMSALAPLTFGATGVLGMVLDREEREDEEEHRRMERRASVVERLVPRRRAKLDRIVVHV